MQIAAARPEHLDAIDRLCRAAFAEDAQARLVTRLRAAGQAQLELVALDAGEVVGHILFSPLCAEMDGGTLTASALGPLSVRPDRQRGGIGTRLVLVGLAAVKATGCASVFVLGHPGYYPRFGFSAALAEHVAARVSGPAFMALELIPGCLAGRSGWVAYHEAFDEEP